MMAHTIRCQARLRIDPATDEGRCPKLAKGAYVIDLDRGVRLLCTQHGNMANRCAVGPMDVESSDLPIDLLASLLEAHTTLAGLVLRRVNALMDTYNISSALADKCRAVLAVRYREAQP